MIRTLSIILISSLLSLSCNPYKKFQEITNINIETYPSRKITLEVDTLNIRVRRILNNLGNEEKVDFINKMKKSKIERIKDIKADTSKITRIFISGNENHVVFHGKEKTVLINLSDKYDEVDFYFESMDSIYKKIEIGSLDRNTGNQKVKIAYPDLKRFAILDLDTSYSSIHIYASSIRPKLKLKNNSHKEKFTNESPSSAPETIEVLSEEGIHIYYEIPNKNRSW